MKKIIIGASFGVLASLAFVSAAPAATWDGGGTNTNWTTANNWNPNGAPSAGAALSFPSGALKLSNTNDFPDLTGFQSLTFLAANYNLGGNDIQLSNGLLSSQPSGTNILALGIALTQDQSFTVQNSGSFLTINGDIDLKTSTLTVGGAGNLISGGQVLGTGDILKDGPGYFRLTGNNSFSGGITVNAGTLEVNNTAGSGTGSGAVIVESGAKVQGDGEIDGEVLVKSGGKISPGDSQPALLATGNLILDPNAVLIAQVNGNVPDTEYSGLKVTGTVTLDQSIFRIALGPDVVIGDSYKIIDNDSNDPVAGTFEGLPEGETFRLVGNDDIGFKITYKGGDGNDVVLGSIPTLTIADASVSEPGSGTATANFAVKLNQASNETITVKYATSAGSALPGDDYNVANGTLTFNPGETVQTIKVEVVSDAVDERDETFSLKLFTPTNASIAQDLATGTITPPIADGNPNPGDGNGSGNGNTGGNGSGGGNGAADSGGCGLGAGSRGSAGFAGALLGALLVAFALRQSRRRL